MHRHCFADSWSEESFRALMEGQGVFGFLAKSAAAAEWQSFALARAVTEDAEIFTLATLPEARRTGLGFAILGAVIEQAKRLGAACLFLEVDARNEAALRLYDRAGFLVTGRRYGYYSVPSGEPADALTLSVKLLPGP